MSTASLREHLALWTRELSKASSTPRLDTEVLFKHASGFNDARLIIDAEQRVDDTLIVHTNLLIKARKTGKPIAYITGSREFYGLDIKLNEHVLIPRPETELLVDIALNVLGNKAKQVLELGTGSGAIALALAANAPAQQVLAVDNDNNALLIAQHNAARLQLNNIYFKLSHWYAALENERFDLIVANPPYIAPDDRHLEQGGVQFEPAAALVSDQDGLADLIQIIQGAAEFLNDGASLIVEHGYNQGERVRQIFENCAYQNILTHRDLAGHERITMANSQVDIHCL